MKDATKQMIANVQKMANFNLCFETDAEFQECIDKGVPVATIGHNISDAEEAFLWKERWYALKQEETEKYNELKDKHEALVDWVFGDVINKDSDTAKKEQNTYQAFQ